MAVFDGIGVAQGYPYGTGTNDGYRQGSVTNPRSGFPGVKIGMYAEPYNIVPLAAVGNNLATSQTPATAGALTLTAGTGVTAVTTPMAVRVAMGANTPTTALQFDVPRAVTVTGSGTTTAQAVTYYGYDFYYNPMVETVTIVTGSPYIAYGKKAFYGVLAAYVGAGTTGPLTLGSSDIFGLPYLIPKAGYIPQLFWGEFPGTVMSAISKGSVTAAGATPVVVANTNAVTGRPIRLTWNTLNGSTAQSSAGIIAITSGTSFSIASIANDTSIYTYEIMQPAGTITVGDMTVTATATTGDVRGTYTVPTGFASDGSRRLTVHQWIIGSSGQCNPQNNNTVYGANQYYVAFA